MPGPCPKLWARPRKTKYSLESLDGYIVLGCWEPRRKFRFIAHNSFRWLVGRTEVSSPRMS